ncbi:hypothetical protein MHTCC0001_29750 [Flavobacteriaceae bacterium MHTCC 0001]
MLNLNATPKFGPINPWQIDSLIKEKTKKNGLTKLDLLVLYQDALNIKPEDSIKIFKNLALLNAEMDQPKDAQFFSEKYIKNTLDFKILNNSAYDAIKETQEYKSLNKKYLPQINTLVFIYFYAALIGLFFAFAINTTKKGNACAKLCIGGFIGFNSIFVLEFVLYMSRLVLSFPHSFRISSSVALLLGPLLFFYFKCVTQKYEFKLSDLWHLLPTVVLLIFLMPIYVESAPEKLRIMLRLSKTNRAFDEIVFLVKIISLICYAYSIWKLQFQKIEINKALPHKTTIKKWFKNLYRIHIAFVVAYLIYGVFAFVIRSEFSIYIYHFQVAAMILMILYIAYMAFVQPNIFDNDKTPINTLFTVKYEKSGLTEGLSNELKEQLVGLLVEEKIYKRSDINLQILSNKLNTTRHNTSQIINEHFEMNFFELINKFRIKEAIEILKKDVHGNLNIIDVAYEVGYNNKVTFNKAFKKETSFTPTEYIQNIANLNYKVK